MPGSQDKLEERQIRDLGLTMASHIEDLIRRNNITDPQEIHTLLNNDDASSLIQEGWPTIPELILDLKDGQLQTATNHISNVYTHLSEAQKLLERKHITEYHAPRANYGIDLQNPKKANVFAQTHEYHLAINADFDQTTKHIYFIIAAILLIKDRQSSLVH